ncbi:FAD-dependent oxidoreductase [Pseudonocardia endophytica]|uniref:Putative polyketide hydroxylase n=1 Tax=Pseudonocardia endophytica TaxID=401976 RepID=A0A4R1HX10_PSEEN|nr:FAD-dependent oxidoreductase [Pseudonocardia endophytica]TCK25330.1 putative polyketide hydroxylase [Pseudonocardia endophytica]
MTDTEVVVVGGGIVGLTATLALARHGIATTLLEAHPGTSVLPRARGVNARAMEVFRELGVEDAIRDAGAPLARSDGILVGHDLISLVTPLPRRDGPPPLRPATAWSPVTGSRGTLDVVEPVVLRAALDVGATVRFGTRVTALEQDDGGVVARRDGGAVHARYAVLADGASGPVRHALGIGSTRGRSHGHQVNVLFECDLAELVRDREFSLAMIGQPGLGGMLTALDNRSRWAFHVHYDPAVESGEDFTPDRCAELVARAIGPGAPPVRVLATQPWEAAERVADRMRLDRVFLAGDTAHQMPPAGGRGASTGVADVHNLAWKLAEVLRGSASETLLDSYEDERWPAGARAVWVSGEMVPVIAGGAAAGSGRLGGLDMHGAADRYSSRAIVSDGPAEPVLDRLDGSPGSRVPHLWLPDGRSTVDLAGDWCVLAGPDRPGGGDVTVPDVDALGIGPEGAVLLRPDSYVAWREPGPDGDPAAVRAAIRRAGTTVPTARR